MLTAIAMLVGAGCMASPEPYCATNLDRCSECWDERLGDPEPEDSGVPSCIDCAGPRGHCPEGWRAACDYTGVTEMGGRNRPYCENEELRCLLGDVHYEDAVVLCVPE